MTTLKIDELIKSSDLYAQAFVHKSFSQNSNFERLEFLGDALLGASVTELLYQTYPHEDEGVLSRWRSALISQKNLARLAEDLGLPGFLKARSSEQSLLIKNERIKASITESFLGAYYLEEGIETFNKLIQKLFKDQALTVKTLFQEQDAKTIFQELAQEKYMKTPVYQKLDSSGPSHDPTFVVGVFIQDTKISEGEGSSLKKAENEAAKKAIEKMGSLENT